MSNLWNKFRRLVIVKILFDLLDDPAVMTFVAFTVGSILVALFGEPLEEFQGLIVYGVFLMGIGLATGAWAKDIVFQWASVNADPLTKLLGRAIDEFEEVTHTDIPDEAEVLILDRVNGSLRRLPQKFKDVKPVLELPRRT